MMAALLIAWVLMSVPSSILVGKFLRGPQGR